MSFFHVSNSKPSFPAGRSSPDQPLSQKIRADLPSALHFPVPWKFPICSCAVPSGKRVTIMETSGCERLGTLHAPTNSLGELHPETRRSEQRPVANIARARMCFISAIHEGGVLLAVVFFRWGKPSRNNPLRQPFPPRHAYGEMPPVQVTARATARLAKAATVEAATAPAAKPSSPPIWLAIV